MSMDLDHSALHNHILAISGLEVDDVFVNDSLKEVFAKCMKTLLADVTKRLMPYIWLETNQSEINQCDFGASFEKLKFFKDKNGVSESWILFATFLNQPVAIKVAAEPHFETVQAHFLMIEREIYKEIVNPIVLCGFSPHVLIYYGSISCDEFFALPELDKEMKKMKKELKAANSRFNIEHIRASVVERAVNGTPLSDFLLRAVNDPVYVNELMALLFQIFYTLKVFSQLGISHNDLHSGNIFVVPATTQIKYYQIGAHDVRRVQSQFDVKIFDFDRGSKVETHYDTKEIENQGLSQGGFCEQFGQCNNINERAEIYPLLVAVNIQTQKVSPEINALLTDIAPLDVLERKFNGQQVESTDIPVAYPVIPGHTLSFSGRLCTCNNQECSSCSILNDPRIKTLDQILDFDQFTSYRIVEIPEGSFIWRLPSVASDESERTWQELHA